MGNRWFDRRLVMTALLSSMTTLGLSMLMGAALGPGELKVKRLLLVHDSGEVVGSLGVEEVFNADGTSQEQVGLFLYPIGVAFWEHQGPFMSSRPGRQFVKSPRKGETTVRYAPDHVPERRELADARALLEASYAIPTNFVRQARGEGKGEAR